MAASKDTVDNLQNHDGLSGQSEHGPVGKQDPERVRAEPGDLESLKYYTGVPTTPTLVARTGFPWNPDAGAKELRPFDRHALKILWKENLAPKVHALLEARKVKWTRTDVVCISTGEDSESSPPVVLWIGVPPDSLSGSDGFAVAHDCFQILRENDITDVEVEIYATRVVPPSVLSKEEQAKKYYYGLPSAPRLVARTGAPWQAPTGLDAYLKVKKLHPVGQHPIQDAWRSTLPTKVLALLDEKQVKWTSLDLVRIGYAEESFAPVVLWIGVYPASLSSDDGDAVVRKCQEILEENNITDVEVEIRESVVRHGF